MMFALKMRRFYGKSAIKFSKLLSTNKFNWNSASLGIEQASTPPSSWYTDSNFLQSVEKKHTFNGWLIACHLSDIKKDGDYIATTINNQPIVVVNSQGNLKAFYNVCRHHAAQICDDGAGKLGTNGRFTCPYHGWQYNADGKLVKAMHMKGCENFSPKQFGLHPVKLDILGPWVYLNVDKTSESARLLDSCPDLVHMHSMLSETKHETLVRIHSRSYTLQCNWKVFVDNYLDGGYHVPVAHPALSAALDMSAYKRVAFDNFHMQSCAPKKEVSTVPDDVSSGSAGSSSTSSAAPAKNRISGGDSCGQQALYLFQYPNVMINRYGHWMDTNIVWPLGVDRCVVDIAWYADPEHLTGLSSHDLEAALQQSEQVQQEDINLCERVQRGLQSDGYDVGRYAPTLEGGEYMFHQKLYKDLLASELKSGDAGVK